MFKNSFPALWLVAIGSYHLVNNLADFLLEALKERNQTLDLTCFQSLLLLFPVTFQVLPLGDDALPLNLKLIDWACVVNVFNERTEGGLVVTGNEVFVEA